MECCLIDTDMQLDTSHKEKYLDQQLSRETLTCRMRWPAESRVSTSTVAGDPAVSAGAPPAASHARLQPQPPATASGIGSGRTAWPRTSTLRLPVHITQKWFKEMQNQKPQCCCQPPPAEYAPASPRTSTASPRTSTFRLPGEIAQKMFKQMHNVITLSATTNRTGSDRTALPRTSTLRLPANADD